MAEVFALVLLGAGVLGAFVVDVSLFVIARRVAPAARRGKAHAAGAIGALASALIYLLIAPVPPAWLLPGLAMVVCNSYIGFHLDNMA